MYIELEHVCKWFGGYQASDDVSFGIEKGELIALLGPSGSGKTTILRMIAGLEHQDSGDISINGTLVNDMPPHERGIGFVFQNYALFPYLSVHDNIAYGLKVQGKPKDAIDARVEELLELVGLPDLGNRLPDQLSGGQKQRVAFARALAPNPQVLLLDEPFAAVDAKVRQELRTWLRTMITQIGITSIFVTHDQEEAMEVADRIFVTNAGKVEQMATPSEIYLEPATPFVAKFIGMSAVVEDCRQLKGFEDQPADAAEAVVRPEFVEIVKPPAHDTGADSPWIVGKVEHLIFRGEGYEVQLDVSGFELRAYYALDKTPLHEGDPVDVLIRRIYRYGKRGVRLIENRFLDDVDALEG